MCVHRRGRIDSVLVLSSYIVEVQQIYNDITEQ